MYPFTPTLLTLSFLLPLIFLTLPHPLLFQLIITHFLNYCNFCVQQSQMTEPTPEHIRTIKYKITLTIHQLHLSSCTQFYTQIKWKRNQNQTSTNFVLHDTQNSIFNEALEAEYLFYYDTLENQYLEKNCDLIVGVDVNGNEEEIKNGGYVRFDLSEPINESLQMIDKKLYLVNSSDSNAYIEFSLLYEPIEETYPLEMSMNLSQVSMPASETYESELKATSKTEIDSMNDHLNTLEGREAGLGDIVSKFELLSREIKKKIADKNTQVKERKISYSEKYVGGEIPQGIIEMQQQIRTLQQSHEKLSSQLHYAEDQKRDLQKLLDKKSRQIISKTQQIHQLNNRIYQLTHQNGERAVSHSHTHIEEISLDNLDQKQQQYLTLRKKYEAQSEQLHELKERLKEYESNGRDRLIDNFYGVGNRSGSTISNSEDNKQMILEKQLANKSHQIGELFNAAFEIGGAPLLDKLQSAIGLVETV